MKHSKVHLSTIDIFVEDCAMLGRRVDKGRMSHKEAVDSLLGYWDVDKLTATRSILAVRRGNDKA